MSCYLLILRRELKSPLVLSGNLSYVLCQCHDDRAVGKGWWWCLIFFLKFLPSHLSRGWKLRWSLKKGSNHLPIDPPKIAGLEYTSGNYLVQCSPCRWDKLCEVSPHRCYSNLFLKAFSVESTPLGISV